MDTVYGLLLFGHLLSAIVGFGSVFLNGIYGARAKAAGPEKGLAIMHATDAVARVALIFILLVPVFGIALVFARSDDAITLGSPWVGAAITLYIVAMAVSFGLLQPALRKMLVLMEQGGGPGMAPIGKRIGIAGGILNVLMVAILVLMVFKPGQ